MFLIGQYDSPFVRRVAIAMRLYGIAFEHRPWSTFGEGDKIAPYNPLRRVPTLVLDDGEALIDSAAMLDYLDELARDQDKIASEAMLPSRGAERRRQLRLCALATGLGDKSVSLLYERVLRKERLELWVERCEAQIAGVLDVLERERASADDAVAQWRAHRPFRYRGRLRAALHARGASASVRWVALSGAGGARRALRSAVCVSRDRAAALAAEGVSCSPVPRTQRSAS